jgi:peptidoglycan/xylan/chitin deacetylase (PgdA/CDA1 family)
MYQLLGTFYISPKSRHFTESELLTGPEIVAISKHFEIGAHTLTHPRLTTLTEATAWDEIAGSRNYLQDVTGCQITSFCYPYGAFGAEHVRLVREAGFTYARTVRRLATEAGPDPLRTPTTFHAYCHLVDIPVALKTARLNLATAWRLYSNWDQMAMRFFDQVLENGGVYHLWGHSWEVDQRNDWSALERVLSYISGRPGVKYAVNGAVSSSTGEVI